MNTDKHSLFITKILNLNGHLHTKLDTEIYTLYSHTWGLDAQGGSSTLSTERPSSMCPSL